MMVDEGAGEEQVLPNGDEVVDVARPRLLSNLIALLSSQVVTWTLALLLAVVLPRFIGPAELGQLRLAGAVWAIASLFVGLGTSVFLTIEMSRDERRGSQLVGTILVVRTLAFVVISGALVVIAVLRDLEIELRILLAITGVVTLIDSFASVYSAALAGLEKMSALAIAAVVSRLLHTVVLLTILFAGGGVVEVAAGTIVGSAAAVVIFSRAYGRYAPVTFAGWATASREVVRRSRVFLVAGATLIVYQQVDTIVMAALVDKSALGWYTTADALFSSLLFVPTVLLASIFPRMSRLHHHDQSELRTLVQQSFSSLMLIGVPIGLGTVVVGEEFAPLLFGEEYRQTGPVLQVFGIVAILVFGTTLFGGIARAVDRQGFWTWVMVACVLVTVPLDLLLVPWTDRRFNNGAIGGALAFLVTEFIMLALGIWKVAPNILDRQTVLRLGKIALCGGVMFLSTWPLRHYLFVVPVTIGAVVYPLMVWITGALSASERLLLADLRHRIAGRGV